MEINRIEELINVFKNSCFKCHYNNNSYDKKDRLNLVKKNHKKCLKKLLELKNEKNYNYDRFIIKMIYFLMTFTIYTRDKYYGMGNYELFKVQFHNYVLFMNEGLIHPKNIEIMLLTITKRQHGEENIGCWKDLKNIASYLIDSGICQNHSVMNIIYDIFSKQILEDINLYNNSTPISYCSKWIPREKSSQGWMVRHIVTNLFKFDVFNSEKNYYFYLKQYRKIISKLNNSLNTAEIYMCKNEWSKINFENKSSNFMKKYFKSFTVPRSEYDSDDRKNCINRFLEYRKELYKLNMEKENYMDNVCYFSNYESIKIPDIINILNNDRRYLIPFINYQF